MPSKIRWTEGERKYLNVKWDYAIILLYLCSPVAFGAPFSLTTPLGIRREVSNSNNSNILSGGTKCSGMDEVEKIFVYKCSIYSRLMP